MVELCLRRICKTSLVHDIGWRYPIVLLACFELRYCNVEIYRGACFTAECFMKLATAKKKNVIKCEVFQVYA